MKRYIMFFISIGLILGIILFYKVMSIDENRKVVFNESGYILNGETDRYYFNQEEKYTTTYNDKIVFNDTEGAKVTVDNDNFVHYQSGNIEGLKDGVLLDLGKIDDDLIVYYNIKATKEVKKVSDRYIVKNLENDLQFDQAIWKISANKYIILGKSIKFKLDDGTEKEVNGYVEIEFFEDEISNVNSEKGRVNIYNQEISYMTSIKDDKYIELSDDIKLNLGTKIVSKKGQNKMSLEDMVINSNDNVTLVDIDEKEENTVEENKVDENTTDNNTNNNTANNNTNNNNNSTTNNNTNNSTTGTGGTTNNNGGTININTPDIKYVESNGTDTKIDSSKVVKEPKFKLENMEVSALGISGNIKIVDEDDLLSKEDDMNIRIVNNSTGKVAYNESQAYGNSFDIPINCETLLPDTQYTIAVTATYIVNNTSYTKNFIYKTFSTSSIGISIKKSGYTDHSLSFDISISDELFNSATVYLLDNNGNNVNEKEIDNRTKIVTFDENLSSNTQYKVKIADIKYSGTLQAGSNWEINYDDCLTLKKLPEIKKLNYAIDKREGKFNLKIEKVEDTDNAVQSYTYVVYEYDETAQEFNTDKPVYQKESKDKEISVDVEDESKAGEEDLIRGKAYGYKVIINSYDNEKYVETLSAMCGTFTMTAKTFPTIEFKENEITATSIKGTLYIHDDEKTITCDKDNKLTIKWKNSLGEEGILEEYTTTAALDNIRKDDAGLPISMDNLKANETYTISVYGTVDLRSDSSDAANIFKNILIGNHLVTTDEYKTLVTTYSVDQNPTEAFALNIKLGGRKLGDNKFEDITFERNSLSRITFFLQAGSKFDKNQSYEKLEITNKNATSYGIESLDDLFTGTGIKLKPSTFNNTSYTANKYIILTTITIDGTDYKNKIPIIYDNENEEEIGLKVGQTEEPYEEGGEKYSATYALIENQNKKPETKQLLTIIPQYYDEEKGKKENYDSSTIIGYKVGLNWGNSGYNPSEVDSITYYVSYATNTGTWEKIEEYTNNNNNQEKDNPITDFAEFEVKEGTKSKISNSVDTSLAGDNRNGLHRGGAYYFWCTIRLKTGKVWYDDYTDFKGTASLYKPTKQEPTIVIYPYDSRVDKETPIMEFKYAIIDIDNAIERNELDQPIFYVYNQDNAYINASTEFLDQNEKIKRVAFFGEFINTNEYTIKYKKITDKTNAEQFDDEYSTITQKYEKIINENEINKKVGYSAQYNQENPNKIKVVLNGENDYLKKIAAAKATITNNSTNTEETTKMLPIKYDENYYIEIDMMKLSNPTNFVGGNTIKVTLYYDTNQIGFQQKAGETEQYVTYVRSDDNYTYEVFEKNTGINNIRGNIYRLNNFSETTLGIDLENMYGVQLATIELQPTYQGLKYNGNIIVQKRIGIVEIVDEDGQTFNIPRIIAGIELPKENPTTDFTTARLTPILTKYGLDIEEIYCNLFEKNEDGSWKELIDEKKTIVMTDDKQEIGDINFEKLTSATDYKVTFKYKIKGDENEYSMYGLDTNTMDPEYKFNTVSTIGVDNINVEYIPISYNDKTLKVTYSIGKDNPNIYSMYERTEYSFYKVDSKTSKVSETAVDIVIKNREDLDSNNKTVTVENDVNNASLSRTIEFDVKPDNNKFDFGGTYKIKIVAITKDGTRIDDEKLYDIEEFPKLTEPEIRPKIIKTYKDENKDGHDKIKININGADESKLIVDGEYTITAKSVSKNGVETDVKLVDTNNEKIEGMLKINENNKILYINNCDYTQNKYVITLKYYKDSKNKNEKELVTFEKTIDIIQNEIDLGDATIQRESDGNISLTSYGAYNLNTLNVAQYTVRNETDNLPVASGSIDIETEAWSREIVNENEIKYTWYLPVKFDFKQGKKYSISIRLGKKSSNEDSAINWIGDTIEIQFENN